MYAPCYIHNHVTSCTLRAEQLLRFKLQHRRTGCEMWRRWCSTHTGSDFVWSNEIWCHCCWGSSLTLELTDLRWLSVQTWTKMPDCCTSRLVHVPFCQRLIIYFVYVQGTRLLKLSTSGCGIMSKVRSNVIRKSTKNTVWLISFKLSTFSTLVIMINYKIPQTCTMI